MRRKHLELSSMALMLVVMLLAGQRTMVLGAEPVFEEDDAGVEVSSMEEEDVVITPDATLLAAEELPYESPQYDPKNFHFVDHFDNIEISAQRWIKSQAKKEDIAEEIAKYDGVWSWEAPQRIVWKNDIGLVLKSKAKHAAIAAPLSKAFTFKDEKPLVVQYEVTLQEGQDCGGSYIKLLSASKESEDLTKFNDKTPYTIMFGPDKCGNDYKMHFIFRHVNPINGSISEKHCRKPKDRLEEPFKDKLPHLYTLIVRPDNTFEVRVDHKVINEGSLLNEFKPAVNPPSQIDDPEDKKPQDWDEREKIPDPTSVKPVDWDEDAPPQLPDPSATMPAGWLQDEPDMIPDPTASKPEDWDTEIDGEWEAPLVDNPACERAPGCGPWQAPLVPNKLYKGKWRAPLIENPNYRGKWAARKIPNPDYFEDLTPFKMTPIAAIGIELWSMSNEILFDNLIITDDIAVADDFAAKSFDIKRKFIDKESETFLNKVVNYLATSTWTVRIAIILIGTPLAYSLYRLCSSGSAAKEPDTDAKKTDAVQPDDPTTSGGDAASSSDAPNAPASPKKKKSDLDIKQDDDVGAAAVAGDHTTDNTEAADEKESDEGAAEEKSEGAEESTTKAGARKRRVRKDQS